MLYGHPIARQLEQWWRDHGGRHDSNEWHDYIDDLSGLLGTKFDELLAEHVNTGADGVKRFGMSGAGSCTRKASLKWLGHEAEPFTGSTQVTFHIGHLIECLAVATLRRVGYVVDGTQQEVRIDPFMASFSDGIIRSLADESGDVILSVKSSAYKHSAKRGSTWVRQGFPSLPFDGVKKAQPSWWAQAQAEMHGAGITQTLVLVVAKDIVKAFEGDPYLGTEGNGSLTFYAEMLEYDPEFVSRELLPVWGQTWDDVTDGRPAKPFYLKNDGRYVRLPVPGDTSKGWGGQNKEATGTFNPCFQCELLSSCKAELAKGYRG